MTCAAFLDRLYDDDVREAQRGGGVIPPDIGQHMAECDTCRTGSERAASDDALLTRALLESPSEAWRARIRRQMACAPRADWTQRIAAVNEVVTWGILAMAASQALLGESSTAASVVAFLTGGVAALVPPSLGRQWMALLRRPVRWV